MSRRIGDAGGDRAGRLAARMTEGPFEGLTPEQIEVVPSDETGLRFSSTDPDDVTRPAVSFANETHAALTPEHLYPRQTAPGSITPSDRH